MKSRQLAIGTLLAFGFSLVFPLFLTVHVQAQNTCSSGGTVCSQAYLDSLPFPIPPLGQHRVVQLVNCSCQTLLGAADTAHRSGEQGYPVLPREGTWIMQPYGTPGTPDNPNPNVLTIDIPEQWENTYCPPGQKCPSLEGPRFWARTGCRYDPVANRAQCETGSCGDQYDCSSAGLVDSGFTSLTEWTFARRVTGNGVSILQDYPDISLVDGANLNVDILPVDPEGAMGLEAMCPAGPLQGQYKCNPTAPTDQHWLMYNYPLTVHGADLRANDPKTNQSCTDANGNSFILKRSDIDKLPTGTYGFVIEDQNGNLTPPGDYPMACFTNCGKYEFPMTPVKGANCDPNNPNDPGCYPWWIYCAGNGSLYYPTNNVKCQTDQDCVVKGQPTVYASCYKNTSPSQQTGFCALRAFYQTPTKQCPTGVPTGTPTPGSPASEVACTFTYGSLNPLIGSGPNSLDYSDQPPALPCSNVTRPDGTLVPCVGDDTIHQVMHGAYTWPNDPTTFGGDSPVYRIAFSPGGTSVPITPATKGIPLCSELPSNYNYAQNFVNAADSVLAEGQVLTIANNKGTPWPGSIGSQRANSTIGVLCRWQPAPTTDSGCSPPLIDQDVTNSTCGLSASGTSLVSSSFTPNNGDPLFLEVAITTPDPAKPIDIPASISGCVPASGPGAWTQVNNGSLSFGSQTNPKQGYIAWYTGISNNSGQCAVTVTLAESAAATLKVYDVPGYSGTVELTSMNSGSFNPASSGQPAVSAQKSPVATLYQNDLMLGSLLQVNQQMTPITYWQDWLTNTVNYSPPGSINCENNLCPADDGTDYLSGHGSYSSNADAGHRAVGPAQQHALERRGEFVTPFNWGGVAIYIELKSTNLAVACPSDSAQVGMPYASPMVTTGGEPDYTYMITKGQLPPGLNPLGQSNPYIYGLPTTANTYPYTAQVTDSFGTKASANCSITVSQ